MSRTLEEPLTEPELDHLRNEFWLLLSDYKNRQNKSDGWDRELTYSEVKEIIDLIAVAVHYVKVDFQGSPDDYSDILGAEIDFFQDILEEAGTILV